MRHEHACIDCAKRQGQRIYRLALEKDGHAESEEKIQSLQEDLDRCIDQVDADVSPAELSRIAIRTAEGHAMNGDPFAEIKKTTNALALSHYADMKKRIEASTDPLFIACQLAACGNIIDLGIRESFDIDATVEKVLSEGFQRNDYVEFLRQIEKAEKQGESIRLLYLCDNAGEIGFDRLFIEELRSHFSLLDITAVVNQGPILNDATMEDAEAVGLDQVVSVIDNGSDELGTVYSVCSAEFQQAFDEADIIVSKGQANYETLSHSEKNIFFVLKAKCEVIAASLGVKYLDAVMTRSPYVGEKV